MRVHRHIFRSKGQGLTRQDLIESEHLLKDAIASFLPFKSYSLYFPNSLPKEMQGAVDSGGGLAVYLPRDGLLLLPLILQGQTLGVFVAKGVKLGAPKALPPLFTRLASMCLEQLLLYKQGTTDALTGLYNRDYFLETLEGEIELIQNSILPASGNAVGNAIDGGPSGYSGRLGLILLDIDNFSRVNDSYGHATGDKVISAAAETLARLCPPQAFACRLGDDVFGMVWPEASPLACENLAERLRGEIAARIFEYGVTGERFSVTASLGACSYPQDLVGAQFTRTLPEQARIVLGKARKALVVAKSQGKNRAFSFHRMLDDGGLVLEALPMNHLTISLGRSADAQEGMRFLVWSPRAGSRDQDRGGADNQGLQPAAYKAEIVLVEVRTDSSLAEVLYVHDPDHPLEPGDRVSILTAAEGFHEPPPEAAGQAPRRDARTGLYAYKDFLALWTRSRQGTKRFSLVMARLAELPERAHGHGQSVEQAVQDIARLARETLRPGDAGGRFSVNSLIYYLPDRSPEEVRGQCELLSARAADELGAKLAVGVAGYPCLDFGRADILENCRKAADHALLLKPTMVAVFDSVSLTISADRHFTHGDIYAAVEEYKLALLADEKNLLARNSLGVCHARLKQLDRAKAAFQAVIKADPKNIMAIYNVGCVHLKLGDVPEAKRAFNRCLKLMPGHVFSLIRLGRLAEESGHLSRARTYYDRALANGEASVKRDLARVSLRQGRVEEAREHLHQALIANPKDAASLHLLAKLYLDSGEDPEIAEALARQSVALRPEQQEYWDELVRSLTAQGKAAEASQAAQAAVATGSRQRAEAS